MYLHVLSHHNNPQEVSQRGGRGAPMSTLTLVNVYWDRVLEDTDATKEQGKQGPHEQSSEFSDFNDSVQMHFMQMRVSLYACKDTYYLLIIEDL